MFPLDLQSEVTCEICLLYLDIHPKRFELVRFVLNTCIVRSSHLHSDCILIIEFGSELLHNVLTISLIFRPTIKFFNLILIPLEYFEFYMVARAYAPKDLSTTA